MPAYALSLSIGVLISMLLLHPAVRRIPGMGTAANSATLIDSALMCVLGGMAGGRLVFVLFHMSYYTRHLMEIPRFWLGGMDPAGAAAGALLAAAALSRFRLSPLLVLSDRLSLALMVISFAHYLGCFLDGCMAGSESGLFRFLPPTTDALGNTAHRWPAAAAAALAVIPSTCFIQRLQTRIPGMKSTLAALMLSLTYLSVSFMLAPPSLILAGMRLETLEGAAGVMLSILAGGLLIRRQRYS